MLDQNNNIYLDIKFKYLRPYKKTAYKDRYSETLEFRDGLSANSYLGAVVLPIKHIAEDSEQVFGHGGVVADSGYINESGINGMYYGKYEYGDVKCVKNEEVIYGGYYIKQWGHFLIEAICRSWYALVESDLKIVFVVNKDSNNSLDILDGNYKELFDLLGITSRVEFINEPVQYKKVIVPEPGVLKRDYYSKEYLRIIEEITKNSLKKSKLETFPSKLFLTRNNFKKAVESEINMEILDNTMRNNGFAILSPENMKFSDLVAVINHAEVVAMTSGSIQHNMLFARENTKTYVFEKQPSMNNYEIFVDKVRKLNSFFVDSYYMLYPVQIGVGPFWFGYTNCMKIFLEDNKFIYNEKDALSDRLQVKKYLKSYKARCGYGTRMEYWQLPDAESMFEAYKETEKRFAKYISGLYPLSIAEYMLPRNINKVMKHVIRIIIK